MARTLYQVPTGYGDIIFIMLFPLLMLAGIALVIRLKYRPAADAGSRRRSRLPLYLGGVFVCVCTLLILHGQLDMHHAVVGAWQRGEYETVEGQVENFVPMPKEGKGSESFDLGGVHFEYSDNCLITGYHNAKVNGGVIRRDGQRLRIGYVWYEPYGNVIVSIEEIDEL